MFDTLVINSNFIYIIERQTKIIIPLFRDLTYHFNFIQFITRATIIAAVYINCNMVIVSHGTAHPNATQSINSHNINILYFGLFKLKHWEVVTILMHITASCQTTNQQKRKISEQKSKNMACTTQWTNKSIVHKTHKDKIVSLKRASKEIQIHINIVYAVVKSRPKGSSKTMTVLSSLGRSFC